VTREIEQVGPYRILRQIGEGGMAWVFEVKDPNPTLQRRLALKLMKPEVASSEEFIRRFEREAALASGIDHPCLLTIYDSGRDEASGFFYYVMNFVDGPNLSHKVANEGPLDLETTESVYIPVLDALSQLHEHDPPIIHRDIKPSNIFLTRSGHPYLGDLGIAHQEGAAGVTRTQGFLGSVLYASPEQARNRGMDIRTDIFAMGLSLYQSLTGRVVYDDIPDVDTGSEFDVIGYLGHIARLREEIEFQFPKSFPLALQKVIRKATRVAREDRYPNARAMRDALQNAIRSRRQPESAPRRPWLAIAASALAAITLLMLGSIVFSYKRSVAQAMEDVAGLDQRANTVMDAARSLKPTLDPELIDRAAQSLRSAGIFWQAAQDQSEGWLTLPAVMRTLERARGSYTNACLGLLGGELTSRADQGSEHVGAEVQKLRAAEAGAHVPEDWQDLEATIEGLAPPSADAPPCEGASIQLDRLAAVGTARTQVDKIRDELPQIWRALADAGFGRALLQQNEARAGRVEAPEYRDAIELGDAAFARGQSYVEAGNYLDASNAFDQAGRAYQQAAAVIPAARARAKAYTAAKAATGVGEDVSLGRVIHAADRLYEGHHWSEAQAEYERGFNLVQSILDEGKRSKAARSAANDASRAHEKAVDMGAAYVASDVLAEADQLLSEGTDALADGDYETARARFEKAKVVYRRAADLSKLGMENAREAQSHATQRRRSLLGRQPCTSLSTAAREQCEGADGSLAEASQALDRKDFPTAFASFNAASKGFEGAGDLEQGWVQNQPKPPTIVSRTPKSRLIKSHKNQPLRLAVEAVDPNPRDTLYYTWLVDGETYSQTGPSLELRLARSADIEVRVSDGSARATERWKIQITNRKPRLSVSPRDSDGPIELQSGKRQVFTARASDPDDDPVQVEFRLGNRVIGGNSYSFEQDRPGDYRLKITANDGLSQTTLFRKIRVVSELTPPGTDAVRNTMEEYKAAYEARSMSRLKRVWKMSPQDQADVQFMFESCSSLSVSLTIKQVAINDTRAEVRYAEKVSGDCGLPADFPPNDYRAQLRRRGGGEWVIHARSNETLARR